MRLDNAEPFGVESSGYRTPAPQLNNQMETIMYVFIESDPGLWTVGFYDPNGKWQPESDHNDREEAAKRVAWLNGSVVAD